MYTLLFIKLKFFQINFLIKFYLNNKETNLIIKIELKFLKLK